jgi:hypothetical protein
METHLRAGDGGRGRAPGAQRGPAAASLAPAFALPPLSLAHTPASPSQYGE